MTAGRPLKFKSVKELEKKIQDYFDSCFELQWFDRPKRDKDGNKMYSGTGRFKKIVEEPYQRLVEIETPIVCGLAVALNTCRQTLLNYEEDAEFLDTSKKDERAIDLIKSAKQRIQSYTEQKLFGGAPPAGVIFNLKNNYNWKDKTEVKQTGEPQQNTLIIQQPNPSPKPTMMMQKVVSSNIAKIGYLEEKKKMRVRFKNGSAYDYLGVPEDTFLKFLAAKSKGGYLASKVKSKFVAQKIADAPKPKPKKKSPVKKK
jgi:hypothetical protein